MSKKDNISKKFKKLKQKTQKNIWKDIPDPLEGLGIAARERKEKKASIFEQDNKIQEQIETQVSQDLKKNVAVSIVTKPAELAAKAVAKTTKNFIMDTFLGNGAYWSKISGQEKEYRGLLAGGLINPYTSMDVAREQFVSNAQAKGEMAFTGVDPRGAILSAFGLSSLDSDTKKIQRIQQLSKKYGWSKQKEEGYLAMINTDEERKALKGYGPVIDLLNGDLKKTIQDLKKVWGNIKLDDCKNALLSFVGNHVGDIAGLIVGGIVLKKTFNVAKKAIKKIPKSLIDIGITTGSTILSNPVAAAAVAAPLVYSTILTNNTASPEDDQITPNKVTPDMLSPRRLTEMEKDMVKRQLIENIKNRCINEIGQIINECKI